MARDDIVGAIEAVYDLDGDEASWLLGVERALAPSIDDGFGVCGITYDVSDPSALRWGQHVAIGSVADQADVPASLSVESGPEWTARLLRWCGARTASQLFGVRRREFSAHHSVQRVFQPHGYSDFLAINACDPDGRGTYLVAPMRRARWLTGAPAQRFGRVASHFAAARRLRRALSAADPIARAEAVLTPGGRVEHARDAARARDARAALRTAAVAMDRARSALRSEPDQALAAWGPLIEGRWSMIDHFDHDGRRFVVALANDPVIEDPRALSLRERQVVALAGLGRSNKAIAYDLGMSVSRVGTYLATAARKLGARSRVELVTLIRALAERSEPAPVSDR